MPYMITLLTGAVYMTAYLKLPLVALYWYLHMTVPVTSNTQVMNH